MASERAGLGALYDQTRVRVGVLLAELPADAYGAPVPACPGWTVHDVVAHLAVLADDVTAGRLTGPPDETRTADQVARGRSRSVAELLEDWERTAPAMAGVVTAARMWPALMDVVSHEHDIRGAVDRPGARDSDAVVAVVAALLRLDPPVPLVVRTEDREVRRGPAADQGGPVLELTTTTWETLRWRMGRRSRAQLVAMDWSGDPGPVLDSLTIFGPAAADLVE